MPATDDSPSLPRGLLSAVEEITTRLRSAADLADTFTNVTQVAVQTIHGCQAASVSLLQEEGFVTWAATDPIAKQGDQIQYAAGEGPCLSAAIEAPLVYTRSMRDDQRWPRSASALAGELGVGSMLSTRLSFGARRQPSLGSLNLYARAEDAFSEPDQLAAVLLASLASVATHHAHIEAHLQKGLLNRQVIGEAVGILRTQHDIPSQEAFALLVTASKRMNIKLRVIAERLVDGSLPYLPETWIRPPAPKHPTRKPRT